MRAIIFILLFVYVASDNYKTRRSSIIEIETKLSLGGNTTLTTKESVVNNCLMQHKFKEIDHGFDHPDQFKFSHHFFSYKNRIPQSKVYRIIKAMPKGAVLHLHDIAVLGPDYWLNVTYKDHLYVCLGRQIQFLFSNKVPNTTCDGQWRLMSDARRTAKNITEFDLKIRSHFTLDVKNPEVVYPDINKTWQIFKKYFGAIFYLWSYKPVWEQCIYDILKSLKDDNIMYAEIRGSLPALYELNGTYYEQLKTAEIYKNVINKFVKDNPDFFGAKLIFAPSRVQDLQSLAKYIQFTREVKRKVPDLIIGFDLVGQEDLGPPLITLVPVLEKVKDLPFFFHAGETNWYGTSSDENLIDAVLLGAKRIGHAYALTKHPAIMKEVVDKEIGLEVNVLSNAVLSLVKDVRNHPLSTFLSLGLPVVLSSDDPGAWEADPLSDDFYVAFVGVASKLSDLRMLKTLALNSLKYSALDPVNKQRALRSFNAKWNNFIDKFECSLY